jgi:hypothetical protein
MSLSVIHEAVHIMVSPKHIISTTLKRVFLCACARAHACTRTHTVDNYTTMFMVTAS